MTSTSTPAGTMPGRTSTGWWTLDRSTHLVHRHDPEGAVRGVVVLLSPPSNEALATHRTERALAGRLVAAGFAVLRPGLSGVTTSQTRTLDDRPLVARWEDETAELLRHAATCYGVEAVDVVGTRLAATLVARAARRPDVPVRTAVLLAPVGSGRQYLRAQTQLLAIAAGSNGLPEPLATEPDGRVATYGMTLDAASVAHLRGYGIGVEPVPGARVVVVGGPDKPLDKAVRTFAATEGVEILQRAGLGPVIDRVSFRAVVPSALLDEIVSVLAEGEPHGASAAPEPDPVSALLVESPRPVVGEVVDVAGMPGVVTRPQGEPTTALLWSPGACEPHDGPSGVWAQLACRLAMHGVATVRFDLADTGERTRLDQPVDPYPYESDRVEETVRALRWTRDRFGLLPDAGGLCSGAWLTTAAAAQVPVRRLVPVNLEQWTNEPTIIEREDTDPETGLPVQAPAPHEADAGHPTGLRARVTGLARGRGRELLKEHLPYRARVVLGRRDRIQAPEPVLDAATARGALVRVLTTQRDHEVFARLHGYRALASLRVRGRDVVVETDANLDHGIVTTYSRERATGFVVRALLGEDIFY